MTKRNKALWAVAVLLALNVVLVSAQLAGAAFPKGLGAYFLGPKMVRAEVILMEGGGLRDYATITLNDRYTGFERLRRGMTVVVVREGAGPVIEVRATGR